MSSAALPPHDHTIEPGEINRRGCRRCEIDRKASAASPSAPAELYDLDLGAEHWLRKDLYETPARAKYAALYELDAEWTRLGCETVWAKPDAARAADAEADGIQEPYDGWSWTSAIPDEPGAVAYWHVYVKGRA